jgi:hypothetical protein
MESTWSRGYDPGLMRAIGLRWLLVPLVALASAQFGHLIAYQLRLGPGATVIESHGAHAYFPLLVSLAGAILGGGLVLGLLLLGAVRLLLGRRRGLRPGEPWPIVETLALLFTLQLAVYLGQETLEAWLSGSPAAPAPALLLWGTLGQLPGAALAALGLSWLSTRLEGAIRELRAAVQRTRVTGPINTPVSCSYHSPQLVAALQVSAPTVFVKRGPPQNLQLAV